LFDIMISNFSNHIKSSIQIGWGINIPDVEKASVGPNERQFDIRDLRPNREYVISLRAFNNIGHGFPIYETIRFTYFTYLLCNITNA